MPKTNHTVVTVQPLMFSFGCSRNQGATACFLLKIRQTIIVITIIGYQLVEVYSLKSLPCLITGEFVHGGVKLR